MIDRKALKSRAKEYAFNNKWTIWKPILIVSLLTCAVTFVEGFLVGLFGLDPDGMVASIINLIVTIGTLPLTYGQVRYIMKTLRGENPDLKESLLSRYQYIVPIFVASLVLGLAVGLGTLLLIVPGIIFAIRFSQVNYLLAEGEGESIKGLKTLSESAKLMKGHYGEYALLILSFFGWYLLGLVTFGIAYIWLVPYVTTTNVYYFEELKKLAK